VSVATCRTERRVNDGEAVIVRRIFELTAAGYGRERVVQVLNQEGAVSPRAQLGRSHAWCPASVHEALHRELYRGVIVWNQSRKQDNWGKKRQRPRDESEWLRIDAPELRIISASLWRPCMSDLQSVARCIWIGRPANDTDGHSQARCFRTC
jgi:site-specific DNA recombinase